MSKAGLVRFPVIAADGTGRDGVARIANTGGSQSVPVPERYWGCFMRVRQVGASMQWGLSKATDAPTIVSNQASALGTGHGQAGASLADGEPDDGIIPGGTKHIVWLASAANGNLEIYVSEAGATSK